MLDCWLIVLGCQHSFLLAFELLTVEVDLDYSGNGKADDLTKKSTELCRNAMTTK